jgi:hypothetical protein
MGPGRRGRAFLHPRISPRFYVLSLLLVIDGVRKVGCFYPLLKLSAEQYYTPEPSGGEYVCQH